MLEQNKEEKIKVNRGALPMVKLTLPLALEQFFRILVSSVDTVMLSSFSENAVAGVGLVSQYVFFLNLLFSVIGTGTSIVLAQYLGANKSEKELNYIAQASSVMITIISLILTAIVIFGTGPLLSCYQLDPEVRKFAWEYFVIYGGISSFFSAFSLLQSSILRCYGYTKSTMIVTIVANIINVCGNAISLYGLFGLPVLGVKGVASSSALSMIVSCILLGIIIKRKKDVQFSLKNIRNTPIKIYKMILSVGVPTAGESLSYNISQIVIMAMISSLGTFAISAQVYTQTIVRFVFVMAASIGSAVQIKTGYYVGAKEFDIAYKKIFKYGFVATCCSMGMMLVVNLIKPFIIGIFTNQIEVVNLVSTLLIYSTLIEFGRSLNLIYVGALKGSGDIKFPVSYGIISMWSIMVLGSFILGLQLGLGIVGFWLAIGAEETSRGFVMLLRWKSKKWQSKSIV